MAISFKDFSYLLEEVKSSKFEHALRAMGAREKPFPKAGAAYEEDHGFLTRGGKYFDLNHIEGTHRTAAEHLIKTVPDFDWNTHPDNDSEGYTDRYHAEMHAILHHHKALRVYNYGNDISVQSAHPLTTRQAGVLRNAALTKGYKGISHQHKEHYDYTDGLHKPDNRVKLALGRTLRLGRK